jgi:hypothetical protein
MIFIMGWTVTIDDLKCIIREHGHSDSGGLIFGIDGCKLLEYIVDVPGFISLLRDFRSSKGLSFTVKYPEPVGVILSGGFRFSCTFGKIYVNVGWMTFHLYGDNYDDR